MSVLSIRGQESPSPVKTPSCGAEWNCLEDQACGANHPRLSGALPRQQDATRCQTCDWNIEGRPGQGSPSSGNFFPQGMPWQIRSCDKGMFEGKLQVRRMGFTSGEARNVCEQASCKVQLLALPPVVQMRAHGQKSAKGGPERTIPRNPG
eukprot:1142355-Pelagomonas_calceolata.AAC.3